MGKRKYTISEMKAELAEWGKEPRLINLTEEERNVVRTRIQALKMYAEGENVKEIYMRTGIRSDTIIRYFEKGSMPDEEGNPIGYRGLLPYARTKGNHKNKLQRIFDMYEGLENEILGFYFNLSEGRAMKRPDGKTAHKLFMTQLIKRGHKEDEYPLNLTDCGLRIFYSWLDMKEEEKRLYIERQKKEAKVEDKRTGTENRMLLPSRPYQIVEIDGHRLDILYSITVYDKDGHEHVIPAERPWLLAAIDVTTRAILSYRVVFETEYDSIDVMKLLEGITAPYTAPGGIRGDGMPSQVFEHVRYALPELIMLDNALAHYANDIIDKTYEYGYQFAYGPVADPTKRPHIERFFGTFERKWGHKLPSTTGSNASDPLRIKAEKDAIRFRFGREGVNILVAMAIAAYNNEPHSSLDGLSPLGMMRKLLDLGYIPNRLKKNGRANFRLYCIRKATFRGNKQFGRHVYVQINNYVYTSDIIKGNYNLVGEKVTLLIDPDNIKVIYAYSESGTYLGPLFIKGKQAMSAGALTMKQAKKVQKYLKDNDLPRSNGLDDVELYTLQLKKKPSTKTNVRNLENISMSNPTGESDDKPKQLETSDMSEEVVIAEGEGNVANKEYDSEPFEKQEKTEGDKVLSYEELDEMERRVLLRRKYEDYFGG